MKADRTIVRKVNYLLSLLFIASFLIFIRVWYLTTVKRNEHVRYARQPQRRTVVEPANRGTILDRFGLPLAINKVQYNATIIYHEIRHDFPKSKERKKYIEHLAHFLSSMLDISPTDVEDLIHSKAAIFPHTLCPIQKDLSEKLYSRLRAVEKEWSGLKMERSTKRFYPQGKVAGNIVGYLGAIDSKQHYSIASDLKTLGDYLKNWGEGLPIPLPKGFNSVFEVQNRYENLRKKAYTIQAQVGRMGVESTCEEILRGSCGKKELEVGPKGRIIRTLDNGTQPTSGQCLSLTLSVELQQFAENLLIQSEAEREQTFAFAGNYHDTIRPPWIKGGAIIAMIPSTGEIVALASHPRFDPNDFLLLGSYSQKEAKLKRVHNWLENSTYRAALWDGLSSLTREHLTSHKKDLIDKRQLLSWTLYLDHILSRKSSIRTSLHTLTTLSDALMIISLAHEALSLSNQPKMSLIINTLYPQHTLCHRETSTEDEQRVLAYLEKNRNKFSFIKKKLDPFLLPISHNEDKLLLLDLLRLACDPTLFSHNLIDEIGETTLADYRTLNQAFLITKHAVKKIAKDLYHKYIFPKWRSNHFKSYLKKQREREKELRTYAHPYTEYLKKAETTLFQEFWDEHLFTLIETYIFQSITTKRSLQSVCFQLLLESRRSSSWALALLRETLNPLKSHTRIAYLRTMRSFHELTSPLWGQYPSISSPSKMQTLAHLAAFFYPKYGFGYGKSHAYSHAAAPASLFKLVTGYEALRQTRNRLLNTPTQPYNLNPLTIYDEVNPNLVTHHGITLGRTETGTLISRYYKGGRLPQSYHSIGKVDFETAIERSSNLYFSLLAGEILEHPKDLQLAAKQFGFGKRTRIELIGEVSGHVPDDLIGNRTGLYASAIGQHSLTATPLQMARMLATIANQDGEIPKIHLTQSKVHSDHRANKRIPIPSEIRTLLLHSLYRVIHGKNGTAHPHRIRKLYQQPDWMRTYKNLQDQWVGKTSTAEFLYRPILDREAKSLLCKDLWFGAISFEDDPSLPLDKRIPELVVIIYLRFGDYGKEAAPLAAQMIQKWRELKSTHQ